MPTKKRKANLIVYLLALIVIVVILVAVFSKGVPKPQITPPAVIDSQVEKLRQQSTSDEIGAIEADLKNTNLDPIDAELKEVEGSLSDL